MTDNLAKHRKKSSKPRKSKKRCWVFRQPDHLKRKCPYIRCFYCHLGHIKDDCRDKKMDYTTHQVVKEKKKKKRNKKRKKKQKNKTERNH